MYISYNFNSFNNVAIEFLCLTSPNVTKLFSKCQSSQRSSTTHCCLHHFGRSACLLIPDRVQNVPISRTILIIPLLIGQKRAAEEQTLLGLLAAATGIHFYSLGTSELGQRWLGAIVCLVLSSMPREAVNMEI